MNESDALIRKSKEYAQALALIAERDLDEKRLDEIRTLLTGQAAILAILDTSRMRQQAGASALPRCPNPSCTRAFQLNAYRLITPEVLEHGKVCCQFCGDEWIKDKSQELPT